MINRARLVQTLSALIGINSENPTGNEVRVARWVKQFCRACRIPVRLHEFHDRRPNVIATLPGTACRKSLLITPHLDTVPAGGGWKTDPFTAVVKGGKLFGLGSTDCKGNLAVALEVLRSLAEDKHRLGYTLIFAATADEESGSTHGLIPLIQKGMLRPDAVAVLDADDFEIVVAQKGLMHLKVTIRGRKAHGAYPWLGVNAIEKAMDILQQLRRYRFSFRRNPFLRPPTMNIGTIRGGDKVNVVAGWCEFELDVRFLPGMSHQKVLRDIKRIVRAHAHSWDIEIEGVQQPYLIDRTHPLVASLSRAMRDSGVRPHIAGSEGATVITFFQEYGIPAVATGFGCSGCAHLSNEYITLDNLYKGARVLERFLKTFKFS
ncbi:MAG TPA: M20 family metallopeptidase [Candidatus Omnitrophota bacterium]|nr:M20 family metallopeptidase [Candidatus Omnitrophota bacterium]